ncbi:hypothetical protein [Paenibacillus sp. 1_12]|nr:hypothetical protein [Paenibacillus sp. 1_12]
MLPKLVMEAILTGKSIGALYGKYVVPLYQKSLVEYAPCIRPSF